MNKNFGLLLVSCSAVALAGCGPSDVASPGVGGVEINPPATPAPTPTPTPTGPATVTAAAGCPTIADSQGLSDQGTITGPTGTWRVCRLPSLIRTSITLPKVAGLLYELNGRVNVGCDGGFTAPTAAFTSTTVGCTTPLTADTNVTLNIQPGVILFGSTGTSWLAVNRGNKINAVGSATAPIVFTSRDNVLGLNDDTMQGQWGGVVLMGRGITTDCKTGTVSSGNCQRETEGSVDPASYGGTDNTYDAGRMSYVQIRYSGFILGAGSELQALTAEAIGTRTVLDHIQSHNSSDDGAEFFGGAINMKYYVATGADDDSLDVDTGAQANLQHVLLVQRAGRGDGLMEIDSNGGDDAPRTKLNVVNFVALQPEISSDNAANAQASLFFRGNSDVSLANGVVVTPNNECIRQNASGTTPTTLTARSVVMQCNATKFIATGTGLTAAQVQAAFGSGANNNNDAFTPTLATLFINGTNEDAVPAFDATAWSTFFDVPNPNRIGVAWTGNTSGFAGWTCNSSTVNFGSTSTACTSLPVN